MIRLSDEILFFNSSVKKNLAEDSRVPAVKTKDL